MMIRRFRSEDIDLVIWVFQDAIAHIASSDYNPEQCRAWASTVQDRDRFQSILQQGLTLVAEDEQGIVAFGQLHPTDHVNFLYCSARGKHKGYAVGILAELEAEAVCQNVELLHTEASLTACGFFTKHGYDVLEQEIVDRGGMQLPRFRMSKQLRSREISE